jgi:hypothetical protein
MKKPVLPEKNRAVEKVTPTEAALMELGGFGVAADVKINQLIDYIKYLEERIFELEKND